MAADEGATDSTLYEVGWYEGGATNTRTEKGDKPGLPGDPNHWNWKGGVIFTWCAGDGRVHASFAESDGLMWTWDKDQGWVDPL